MCRILAVVALSCAGAALAQERPGNAEERSDVRVTVADHPLVADREEQLGGAGDAGQGGGAPVPRTGPSQLVDPAQELCGVERSRMTGKGFADEQPVAELRGPQLARRVAVVAQETPTDLPVTVAAMVLLGRAPHRRALAAFTRDDHRAVASALARVGGAAMARRWTGSASRSLGAAGRPRASIASSLSATRLWRRPASTPASVGSASFAAASSPK